MARPEVADGGDDLQIWREAANILNKKSRRADKGWSASLGLVTKILKKPRTWKDSLDKRPKRKKMDMRFGTWNVRSLYRAGSLRTVKLILER
jgi:hypothetical protein